MVVSWDGIGETISSFYLYWLALSIPFHQYVTLSLLFVNGTMYLLELVIMSALANLAFSTDYLVFTFYCHSPFLPGSILFHLIQSNPISFLSVLFLLVGNGLSGKRGTDVYIRVPLGTVVTERLSDNLQNFIVRTYS